MPFQHRDSKLIGIQSGFALFTSASFATICLVCRKICRDIIPRQVHLGHQPITCCGAIKDIFRQTYLLDEIQLLISIIKWYQLEDSGNINWEWPWPLIFPSFFDLKWMLYPLVRLIILIFILRYGISQYRKCHQHKIYIMGSAIPE